MKLNISFIVFILISHVYAKDIIDISDRNLELVAPDPNFKGSGDPRPRLFLKKNKRIVKNYEFVVDTGTPYKLAVKNEVVPKKSKSSIPQNVDSFFELEIEPTYNASPGKPIVKEKLELSLNNKVLKTYKNNGAIDITEKPSTRQYIGFDIYFPDEFELPPAPEQIVQRTFLILFQALQLGGTKNSPALALTVKGNKNKKGKIIVQTRKRKVLGNDSKDLIFTDEFELKRNIWHRVIIQMEPAFEGSGRKGQYAVWVDGKMELVHRGEWGADPKLFPDPNLSRFLKMALGIYRGSMDRKSIVRLKNIKLGRQKSQVE